MKQRLNYCLALIMSLIMGASPVLAFAGGSDHRTAISFPKSKNLAPLPKRTRPLNVRRPQTLTQPAGQSATVLPDGRLLLLGGEAANGTPAAASIRDERTGVTTPLTNGLRQARAWHSATMLPDGRVFVLGGISPKGSVVESAEVFDPAAGTFELLPSTKLSARAYHTVTLLTDGSLLIAGGVSSKGRTIDKIELWDADTATVTVLPSKLNNPRQKHKATLLADGNVLLEGGIGDAANAATTAEIYDPAARSVNWSGLSSEPTEESAPYLAASLPANGETSVPVEARIAVRFSKPLRAETINSKTLKLNGPQGVVAMKIVPAEGGKLAFVTPLKPLAHDTTYTVSVAGSIAQSNLLLTPAVFSFTTVHEQKSNPTITPGEQPFSSEEWIPDATNLARGNWRSNRPAAPAQSLPPLQAEEGVTALAGQALTLNGKPLANVTLQIDNERARTDATGRFLLKNVPAGHHVLRIDGGTASRPGTVYGIFPVGVDLTQGQTNVLPFTIWMPKLDEAHATSLPSPTTRDMVITTPLIPGLELHLPRGTVIRDLDGRTVKEISITPVPTDRPPFPLPPGFNVPVFASIQPGGARIIPPRAKLIYPNYTNERPGARINFWNYDPAEKGWYVYGQGTVTANGKQIVPDAGVAIYEFSGIMINTGNSPPGKGRAPGNNGDDGDPVDLGTGLFVLDKTDLVLPDTLPVALTRTYRPEDSASRPFGIGSTHPYEMFLWSANQYTEADLILPDGSRVHYARTSAGTGFDNAVFEHTATPTAYYKSQIKWNGLGWDLTLKDGSVYVFGDNAPLQSIRDRYGNQILLTRSNGQTGNIAQITSPNGRWIALSYDSSNRITQAQDNSGRTVGYTYDSSGRLWKVTDPKGGITEYTYDTSHRLLTIKDARGITYLTNQYDSSGRVTQQTQADSTTYQFAYTVDGSGKITQTDVTDPRGNVRRVTFNSSGYTLTDTYAYGTSLQQTVTYTRQSGTNLILSLTDPLNRVTAYTYDSQANVTSITRLSGTTDAVTTTFTYEPTYNQLASITDPLNHTTSYAYDSKGNLTSLTDPLNHQVTFAYNGAGQLVSMTDALSNTTQWAYDSGDLASITNPLGNTTSRYLDALGRPTSTTDALGRTTRFAYNALNQPVSATDPLGGVTLFTYDANGNLLSVTDALSGATSYTYNNMDRLVTSTDPLSRQESYEYDAAGNLVKFTDRRGKVTSFSYDNLDRKTFAGFGTTVSGGVTSYESNVAFTYDAGNRLTQEVDSQAGTISLGYDDLDRLTSETTPQGTVSYGYDAGSRQTSMTVTGQSAINYTYDVADRLTGIAKGTSSIAYTYDAADRRTSVTLPNGLVTDYSYDAGSNLTGMTYRQGTTSLGDLAYTYDAARNRIKMGGSYARTSAPSALTSTTHDAANQLTQRGSTTLAYDANGNLTSDGTNTYTWDARNRLSAISGGTTASFQYDAFGRRISKTVNSQTTQYVYDGLDVVQELTGGTVTANMLNGAVVDERHACECSTAVNSTFLSDGLGSTLALTDSTGAVQTQYTYDAFGSATSSGTASSNTSQYTGRENDGTGLHYYRARYYSPSLQRFISQDPLGFGGGDSNLYAYVGNSPTNFTDPSGMNPLMAAAGACLEGALVSVAMDAAMGWLAGRKITFEGVTHSALMGCVTGLAFFGLGRVFGKLRGLGRGAREAGDGAGACFVAGTKVQTATGEKNIEDVAAGDVVLSSDPERSNAASSGQPERQAVSRTFVRTAPVVLDIHIGKTTITATPEHPFWVVGAGWTAAGELRRGSAVLTKDGIVLHVDSIERREGSFQVYNFEVANTHTYYVSALGILVHNTYRPPNLTPKGAKRPGAFNQAKRDAGIPTSQQPTAVRPNVDRMGNRVPGRQYDFDIPANGGGTRRVTIRDDAGGHNFGPNNPQNRGPHFNGPGNTHYDY